MPPIRELSPNALPDPGATAIDAHLPGYAKILLRVLAISGYGLWIWRCGLGAGDGADRPLRHADAVGTSTKRRWQAGCWRPGDARGDGFAAPFIASSSRPVKVASSLLFNKWIVPR
ncbi:hypothetical protein [Rhodanobacter soli]|uniref:hypothetical protein n=1 Tax=Rhodanobacter soli TaxID=590609 RepID=UPI0031D9EFCC